MHELALMEDLIETVTSTWHGSRRAALEILETSGNELRLAEVEVT